MLHNVSNRQVLLSTILILSSGTLFSQVNIKERVEIKPKPPLQKSSIQNVALFAANPDSNQGRHQGGAILVQYPCKITVTATMEVQPGSDGGYPPTDLAMFSSSGTLIAWYKGYPDGSHGTSGGTASYAMTCGRTGVELWNTMGYDDVTNVTRSIGSSSATITFKGKLLQYWTFTATATLTAAVDDSYDLATVELLPASSQITQCEGIAYLHAKLTNNKGESYTGIPCQGPPPPMTLTVESGSDVELSCAGQQGEQLTLAAGDVDVTMSWNYQGESENSTATVTLTAEGKTSSATVDLVVDKTLRWLEFEDIDDVLYLTKTKVRVALYDCSSWGGGPLLDGSMVDLEITEGAEFGSLLDPKTGQQGKKLTSVSSHDGFVEVEYWANAVNPPERWERVVIRATSGEASDQGSLYVFPGDLIVTLGRSEINFGDTTGIIPGVVRPWGGSPTPVSQDWQTMYQVVKADTIGYFYTPDSSKAGSPLIGRYPEARFCAKNYTSPPDSVVVVIKVTAVDPNSGGVAKIVDGEHPTKGQPITKSLRSTKTSLKSTTGGKKSKVMDEPPNLGEGSYHYGAAQLVVKKKEEELDHFKVTLEKDTIAFTETSKIFVQAKDAKDADIELDPSKLLKLTVTTNEEYGTFINKNGDTVKTIPAMLDNVSYGDAKAGLIRFAAVKKNPDSIVVCKIDIILETDSAKTGEKEILVKPNLFEILLGESKYFYLRNDGGKISIDSTSNPSYEPKINEDVWFSEPVSIANIGEAKAGKRLGVYWEKKKPNGTSLASGMIRLIGRYWHADSTYMVKLSAVHEYEGASVTIMVKKPTRLGTKKKILRNVFNNEFNLDTILVKYGGMYGVPPQMLKGQVGRESNFRPAYRWEPIVDARYHKSDNRILQNRHLIKSQNEVGIPGIPPDHLNVYPIPYWGFQGTIWDLMYRHSFDLNGSVIQNSSEDMYSRYNSNGDLLWGSEEVAEEWISIINRVWNNAISYGSTEARALDMARDSANHWLRYRYLNGAMNNIAQTRISSSYGFIQPLYGTAIAMRFPYKDDQHPPELINLADTVFTYAVPYLVKMLTIERKVQTSNENNWNLGWDKTLQIAFACYNKPSLVGEARFTWNYGIDVRARSQDFLPQR